MKEENTKIIYTKVGDYYIPNIIMPKEIEETKEKFLEVFNPIKDGDNNGNN